MHMISPGLITEDKEGRSNDNVGNGKRVGLEGACKNGSISVILTDPEVLDCPICFEPLVIPVYQCGNGHIAHSSCSTKFTKECPSCSLPIGNNRCRAIERVLESVEVKCQNEEYGCKETMTFNKKNDHEKTCTFVRHSYPVTEFDYEDEDDLPIRYRCRNHNYGDSSCCSYFSVSENEEDMIHKSEHSSSGSHPFDFEEDDYLLCNSRGSSSCFKRKPTGSRLTDPPPQQASDNAINVEPPSQKRKLVEPSGRDDMEPREEDSPLPQTTSPDADLSHFFASAQTSIPESFVHQLSNLSPLSMRKEVTKMAMQLAFAAVAGEVSSENHAINESKVVSDLKKKLEKVTRRKRAAEEAAKLAEDKHEKLRKRLEDEKIKRKRLRKLLTSSARKCLDEQLNNAYAWQEEQKKAVIVSFRRSDEYHDDLDNEFNLGSRSYRKACLDAGIDLSSLEDQDEDEDEDNVSDDDPLDIVEDDNL